MSQPHFVPREPAPPMVLQLGQANASSGQTVSMSVLWQSLRHRLKLAAPLGLVLAALACGAVTYFSEERYRSQSVLTVVDKRPFLAFPTQESSTDFAQTQVELLKNPFIVGRAIESEGLAQLPELHAIRDKEDYVLWIIKRLKAVRIGKSELYEVSFTAPRKESARKVVEAIVDTYMQVQSDALQKRRQEVLAKLKDELTNYDGKIEMARIKLRGFTKESGGDDGVVMDAQGAGGGATRAVGRFALMSNLQQRLVDAEVEVEVAKAQIESLVKEIEVAEAAPDANDASEGSQGIFIPDSYIEARIEHDPAIVALQGELQKQQKKLTRLLKDSPQWATVQEEIGTLKQDLDAKKAELKPAIVQEAEQKLAADRREALSAAQDNLKKRQQTAQLLGARVAAERGAQSQHGDKSLEL
ncbi:MAG TPA: hypothetical protein VGH74_14190, partial [Planctomycetaceae bacterium]